MMAVAVARGAAEAAGEHVRPEHPDRAHQVCKRDVMPVPFVEGLFRGLGEAEIHHVAEALFHAVILVGLQKLQRAQDAKFVGTFGAKFVLAAFAARDCEKQRRGAVSARFQREHPAVFVVGMGDGLHDARRGFQLGQQLRQVDRAQVFRQRPGVRLKVSSKKE